MELEEAIDICKAIKKNIRYKSKFDLNILKLNQNNEEAIETVLQALEELQQKEKSRIIGNINEIKIENLEPILKPYYIPKEKIKNKIEMYKLLELESFDRDSIQADEYRAIIKELQELLEE